MTNKLISTEFGLVGENIDALVTTDKSGSSGLLIIGGQSFVVTRNYQMTSEPIKSRTERVFEKMSADFHKSFESFCEMFTFKKYKVANNSYWKVWNEKTTIQQELRAVQKELEELKAKDTESLCEL